MATGTAVDVVMPQMGVSVSEGTITKWSKSVGDTIEADVERRLAPGVEQVEPLLALAVGAQLLGVHVDAMGAAIELRGAELH